MRRPRGGIYFAFMRANCHGSPRVTCWCVSEIQVTGSAAPRAPHLNQLDPLSLRARCQFQSRRL